MTARSPDLRLTSIHCYPIKSCRGVSLRRATTDAAGIELDRRWMVVDANGRFVSQREESRLATVAVAIEDGHVLRVSAAGRPDLVVPIRFGGTADREVTVWSDRVSARHEGEGPAEWFSALLGAPHALVFLRGQHLRQVAGDLPPLHMDRTAFTDAMPILLTSEASLADLNRRLDAPVPMNRFRPNLVVAGADAWAEDEWTTLRIGAVQFFGVRDCGRCIVTTTDQETGERGPEPLRTLATFRRRDGKTRFGRYLVYADVAEFAVGDEVRLGASDGRYDSRA